MVFVVTYLIISLVISLFSYRKRISFSEALLINLFLTPIVGLISIIKSADNIVKHHYSMTKTCNNCNYEVDDNVVACPKCNSEMSVSFVKKRDFKIAH